MWLICLLAMPAAAAATPEAPALAEAMAAARRCLDTGALDRAQQAADEAVRLAQQSSDPNTQAAALNLRGLVAAHKLDPDAAAADWHEALALATRPDLRAGIVDSQAADLARRGRSQAALELVRRALGELPQEAVLWRREGETLLAMHRPPEALAAFERAASLRPAGEAGPQDGLAALGAEAALDVGDPAAALRWMERCRVAEALAGPGRPALPAEAQRGLLQSLAAIEAAPLAVARARLATLPASLLIEFQVGPRRVALVAVSPTAARVAEVPLVADEFAYLAAQVRNEASAGVAGEHAALLSRQLFAPCADLLPTGPRPPGPVLIVGPASVRGLPFDALLRVSPSRAAGTGVVTAASLAAVAIAHPVAAAAAPAEPGTGVRRAGLTVALSMISAACLAVMVGYALRRSWKGRAEA